MKFLNSIIMRYNNQAGLLHQCERKGPPPKKEREKEKIKSGGERGRTRDQRAMEELKNQMKTAKAKLKLSLSGLFHGC